MNIMIVETSDALAFEKAIKYLKKHNFTVKVVEHDLYMEATAQEEDDFDVEFAKGHSLAEGKLLMLEDILTHFDENGRRYNRKKEIG